MASFAAIEEAERKRQLILVMNWLSAADSILDQEAAASVRRDYPPTGRWILEDPKIKAWCEPSNSVVPIVWINGIPGAGKSGPLNSLFGPNEIDLGKTVLTSLIVEHCQKLDTSVAFFYCKYQDAQRNTFLGIARAVLAQLLGQNEDLLPYLYEQCISSNQVSLVSAQTCEKLLEVSLKTMSKTYVIIDGIDECDSTERKAILSFFTSIIHGDDSPGRLRGLFVSQAENDIRKLLQNSAALRLTDSHNKSDIEYYTAHWSLKVQQKFELPDATLQYIRSAICDGSEGKIPNSRVLLLTDQGMFLFAKLVLLNLWSQPTRQQLYQELQPGTFPKGFEQAYVVNPGSPTPYMKAYKT